MSRGPRVRSQHIVVNGEHGWRRSVRLNVPGAGMSPGPVCRTTLADYRGRETGRSRVGNVALSDSAPGAASLISTSRSADYAPCGALSR